MTANGPGAAQDSDSQSPPCSAFALTAPANPIEPTCTSSWYRCRICGETYLAMRNPGNWPVVGARSPILRPPWNSTRVNSVELTEVERGDLESSIEIERANTRIYLVWPTQGQSTSCGRRTSV